MFYPKTLPNMKNTNTKIDWDKIAEITGACHLPEPPPGSFTVDEYAKQYGLSYTQAARKLKGAIDAGGLKRTQVKMPSWSNAVYYYHQ